MQMQIYKTPTTRYSDTDIQDTISYKISLVSEGIISNTL